MTHVISSYFLIGYPFIVLAEYIVKINRQTSSGNDAMSMVLKHSSLRFGCFVDKIGRENLWLSKK